MTEADFQDWQAFFSLSPFGDDVEEARSARTLSWIAGFKELKGRFLDPSTYMHPSFTDKQKPAEKRTIAQRLKKALGGQ